eukprot:CAMPEP_0119131672 /NCGR_PEP_ID=MMETSP1310-20130426/10514_1 /TAXON_ID=464262 /ORGANISM="Genus nov. species nov., Strain RCC2339" /LENGTH=230 /DNA_ID=CAMNT_0007122263 /DNA_START=86 /DNA_END=778 /DNA_ORIENTATION=-
MQALFIFTETFSFPKGDVTQQTGWYLPEAAHPYHELKAAGFDVIFATPNGKPSHVDNGSVEAFKDKVSLDFLETYVKDGQLKNVLPLTSLKPEDFKIVFFPGGHGPMFDLAVDEETGKFAAAAYEQGGVVGAVCHGPAALVPIKLSSGEPLVKGKQVAAFTNDEEDAVSLSKYMPFMLSTKLRQLGAQTVAVDTWQPLAVTSERLVTGQNPASGTAVGEALVKAALGAKA